MELLRRRFSKARASSDGRLPEVLEPAMLSFEFAFHARSKTTCAPHRTVFTIAFETSCGVSGSVAAILAHGILIELRHQTKLTFMSTIRTTRVEHLSILPE